jgi:hypothetical protein
LRPWESGIRTLNGVDGSNKKPDLGAGRTLSTVKLDNVQGQGNLFQWFIVFSRPNSAILKHPEE